MKKILLLTLCLALAGWLVTVGVPGDGQVQDGLLAPVPAVAGSEIHNSGELYADEGHTSGELFAGVESGHVPAPAVTDDEGHTSGELYACVTCGGPDSDPIWQDGRPDLEVNNDEYDVRYSGCELWQDQVCDQVLIAAPFIEPGSLTKDDEWGVGFSSTNVVYPEDDEIILDPVCDSGCQKVAVIDGLSAPVPAVTDGEVTAPPAIRGGVETVAMLERFQPSKQMNRPDTTNAIGEIPAPPVTTTGPTPGPVAIDIIKRGGVSVGLIDDEVIWDSGCQSGCQKVVVSDGLLNPVPAVTDGEVTAPPVTEPVATATTVV